MTAAAKTEILFAGAGPIGRTAAIEVGRRGIPCPVIDSLPEPPQYAKAVGVQPRTLEALWHTSRPPPSRQYTPRTAEWMSMSALRSGVDVSATGLPVIVDADGDFATTYRPTRVSAFVARPAGYVGFGSRGEDGGAVAERLMNHLSSTFR